MVAREQVSLSRLLPSKIIALSVCLLWANMAKWTQQYGGRFHFQQLAADIDADARKFTGTSHTLN